MLKRIAALSLITSALVLGGCSNSGHGSPPPEIAAQLTIENFENEDVDIFLDGGYVGTVAANADVSFAVFPGVYDLDIDFVGDGEGPIAYSRVELDQDVETIVSIERSLIGLLIDILLFD
ncbi:MAG: hypothetical protein P1V97_03960 [Planctomycetota bacterium]|nr:hypothetical protein [Planctomycetota bacterium]